MRLLKTLIHKKVNIQFSKDNLSCSLSNVTLEDVGSIFIKIGSGINKFYSISSILSIEEAEESNHDEKPLKLEKSSYFNNFDSPF